MVNENNFFGLEVGDTLLCTVDRIVGTVVFVKLDDFPGVEASIITAEIAPGRIRNLRDYVVPQKKIVCKILRISSDKRHIDLSLRRVNQKEKKEVMQEFQNEKTAESILKGILKEKASEIIEKIKKVDKLYPFLQSSKEDSKELEKIAGKENTEKVLVVLKSQKSKEIEIKKEILLKTKASNGLEIIKNIFSEVPKNVEVKYISAGKYLIKIVSPNFKDANSLIQKEIEKIQENAKKHNLIIEVKDLKH